MNASTLAVFIENTVGWSAFWETVANNPRCRDQEGARRTASAAPEKIERALARLAIGERVLFASVVCRAHRRALLARR